MVTVQRSLRDGLKKGKAKKQPRKREAEPRIAKKAQYSMQLHVRLALGWERVGVIILRRAIRRAKEMECLGADAMNCSVRFDWYAIYRHG
jgi:hypothetical protein